MMKFAHFDRRSGEFVDGGNPRLCSFGITEALIPIIATLATSAGVGATTAATIGSIAAPALVGAGVGAGGAALMGGDPGQGALFGALGNAAGPALGAMGLTSGSGAGLLGGALTGAGGGSGAASFDNPVSTSGVDTSLGMDGATTIPGSSGPLSQFAGQSTGGGLNLKGILAALAGVAQGANRPASTSAPLPATFNDPYNTSGYINRQATGAQPATGSWYTYGTAAEPQFFSGNQLHMAQGGALSREIAAGHYSHGGGAFSTGGGQNYVEGQGGGQEDNIPAKLSPGEFVMDAGTVSRLGDGNSDEGAKRMEQIRHAIAGDTKSNGVVQRPAKSPLQYLQRAA